MAKAADRLIEIWRGDFCESVHRGHIAVWHAETGLIAEWGDADQVILPRSSAKLLQALPLVESGAADAAGLTPAHLALACASHQGATLHTGQVSRWLSDLGLDESALRCGPEWPRDETTSHAMICKGEACTQEHNNCSGKHTGFLTLNRHLNGDAEYLDPAHPVQIAVRAAIEDVAEEDTKGHAIDGCSAPNFAMSLSGLARAMARVAAAQETSARERAMVRLRGAMMAHPDLVAGEGRACTRLMRAMGSGAAIKTGAEGVFVACVPSHRIGVALKIEDGTTRASEAAITQLLVGMGLLDKADPVALAYTHGPIRNRRGIVTGAVKPVASLVDWRP